MVRRPSILVVGEDDALRDSLVRAIRAHGARAETARGPAEALAILTSCWPSPSAILLDLQGLGERGAQLVRDIRAHPRHGALPVLTMGRTAEGAPPAHTGCDAPEVIRLLLSLCRTERPLLPGLRWAPQPA